MVHTFADVDVGARRCVVFDFDGTLADTKAAICRTARGALLEFGLREDQLGDLGRLVGPPFPDAFQQVYGLSSDDAAWVTERYRQVYPHLGAEAWPVFDGVPEMLAELRAAGKLTMVASSKRQDLVERGIADNHLEALFDLVCGRRYDGDVTKGERLAQGLGELHVSCEEAVMVGDRSNDAEAARANGMPCVGVLFGNTGTLDELRDAGCAVVVETPAELTQVLVG